MATTPTIAAIRAAVTAQLMTIAGPAGGAGRVYNRSRHTVSLEDFQSDFLDTDSVVRVTLVEQITDREEEDEARYKYWAIWRMVVTHIRHFDDASSPNSTEQFSDELEKIKAKIRANSAIFGIPAHDTQRVAQVAVQDQRKFGEILCHYTELTFEVEATEIIAP